MRTRPQGAALVFVHIPKTAGTTVVSILSRMADGPTAWLQFSRGWREQWLARPEAERASYEFLSGHVPYGLHEHHPRPCVYATMLRDPVERVVSHYYHVLRTPTHYLYQRVVGSDMSLHDYAASDLTIELDNHQTRMLSGLDHWARSPIEEHGPELLRLARDHIASDFCAVGLTERIDDSLRILAHVLGWSEVPAYESKRVASRPRSIEPDVRETILRRNRFDDELYRWAAGAFDAALAALPDPA